jgi:SAM-dependent methyltransferase
MAGSCCSPFTHAATEQFNPQKVAQELETYHEKGPGPTTQRLADGIAASGELRGTVLDIGAGFGGLALALLDRGATHAVAVDASAPYVQAARDEATRQGRADAIEIIQADFVDVAPQLPSCAIVTLDRVVCCYPACEPLLDAAVSHAERCLALSYPRDRWYVRLALRLENSRRWLARNAFRTFVHPAAKIDHAIERAGFTLSSRRVTWMWAVDVYVRR